MRKFLLTTLITGAAIGSGYAQNLFTYGNKSVTKEEFLRVYKKNALKGKADMSDTALKSYLDLYSLFRMKVAEAEKQHLDTVEKIKKDLDSYRKSLARNYLTDEQMTNKLVKEAYDRMKENIHVEYILISCPPGSDSTAPYKKIDSIYKVLVDKKGNFEDLAKDLSDDKGTKDRNGDAGFLTSMQTVYPFENAMYNTPVGKFSKPFRTQFGYVIVKVLEKRKDIGTMKVAQILLATPKLKGEEGVRVAKAKADSISAALKAGASFSEMVKKYSEDNYSLRDSGVLKPFGSGTYRAAFENAAVALKNPGDISAPVKTDFGFHIIKLISKTDLKPFDSIKNQLKKRVENDSRASMAREVYMAKVKEKNGYKEFSANIEEIYKKIDKAIVDTGKARGSFNASSLSDANKPVFTLDGVTYTQYDFVKFLDELTHSRIMNNRMPTITDGFTNYTSKALNDVQEKKLEKENPEFRNLMSEYRDGILLFELMDRNVWSKASKDSAGLKAFFETRKGKYMWEPGFEGSVYTFKNKAALDTGMMFINDAKLTDEEILKALNTQSTPDRVNIQRGRYEFSKFRDASQAELTNNNKKVINMPNGSFKVVYARQIFNTPGPKTLEEARGYVVAEYQDFLEKQFNEKMRREFPVKVNDAVLKSCSK